MLFAAGEEERQVPLINAGGVVNGASFVPAPDNFVAPNSIISIFGVDLALRTEAVTTDTLQGGRLPRDLAGVSVHVGGRRAPLYFVSPTQINAQLPAVIVPRPQPWTLRVVREGLAEAVETEIYVRAAAPGLFPVIAHADFTIVESLTSPARPGEIVILFATGTGPTQPPVEEGQLPPFGAPAVLPHRVFLGGAELPPENTLYLGQAPYFAGLHQINLLLPQTLQSGDYEVAVEVNGALSQPRFVIPVERIEE